jgi:hypothetical protein
VFIFAAFPIFAASVVNFSVEPTRALKKSYIHEKDVKWQWMFSGEYGWLLTDHLSLGANVSFLCHIEKDRDRAGINTDIIYSKERIIMFPVSAFLVVDPIPQYVVHPVVHIVFGYNSVVISNKDYDENIRSAVKLYDGYYNGFYTKFGTDLMVDVGEKTSLFVGPQWQISTVQRRGKDEVFERKFNGFGLRLGVSILL